VTKRKIFVVGLTHTGKNSLDVALTRLGYSCKHYPHPNQVMQEAARYDVLSDTPVISYMVRLDRHYPDARFILTVREIESWLKSCEVHWKRRRKLKKIQKVNRKRVYGATAFDAERFRKVYIAHEAWVRKHFAGRPDKLLVLNVCGGEGYEKLCPFLGVPVIDKPFPHVNRKI